MLMNFMIFIFPQNFNFKNKILGIIDYTTALANVLWYTIIFIIVSFFCNDFQLKIFIFIIFAFPFFLISITGLNGENIIYVFHYLIKFFYRPKLYLYSKN